MIKLFVYEKFDKTNEYFQEEDYNIPFLGGSLLEFVFSSYDRFAKEHDSELKVYFPKSWIGLGDLYYENIVENLDEDHDIVFITHLYALPVMDYTTEDYHFLKQNPGKLFHHPSGIKMGYLNKHSDLSRMYTEELSGFQNIITLDSSNFLAMNQSLVAQLSAQSDGYSFGTTYGNGIVQASPDNVKNSTICGPCFIGEDVHVINSVIYPGTVLMGNTLVYNSEIFESFVCESTIKESTIKNTIVAMSNSEEVSLENSILSKGSNISGGRKR